MNKDTLLTMEELLAWRELDIWRRANQFREMFPHQGFHGSKPIVGCNCCTCATQWHLTDLKRIEKHNSAIETPLKNEFMTEWYMTHENKIGSEWKWSQHRSSIRKEELSQSKARAKSLKEFISILEKPRNEWTKLLLEWIDSKKTETDMDFVYSLNHLLVRLLTEEVNRLDLLKETSKQSITTDWFLRDHVPNAIHIHKRWNTQTK
jgi:hypothetical protein